MSIDPKYRQLSSEELQLLEKDFIDFLVVNGITADDWIGIKKEDTDKAHKLLMLFSDVVFEKMMRKTEYLVKRMGNVLMCFHYGEKEATLLLVENLSVDVKLSELDPKDIDQTILTISKQSKAYNKQREIELFQMIERGAEISDGKLFSKLC